MMFKTKKKSKFDLKNFAKKTKMKSPKGRKKLYQIQKHDKIVLTRFLDKDIKEEELHKIVMYVVQEKFTEHHYEHVECPEKFTI